MEKKISPLRAIRKFCVECVCGDLEWIRKCPEMKCPLFPYRKGKNTLLSSKVRQMRAKDRNLGEKHNKVLIVGGSHAKVRTVQKRLF